MKVMRLFFLSLLLPLLVDSCSYHFSNSTTTSSQQKYRLKRHRSGGTRMSWEPLKIYTVYKQDVDTTLTALEVRDLSNYITRAISRFSSMVQVRSLAELTVDDPFTSTKLILKDYNFALFIKVESCSSPDTLAMAKTLESEKLKLDTTNNKVYYPYHSQFNSTNDNWRGRPISGEMQICISQFRARNSRKDGERWTSTIMHEITHALVFSPNLFKDFIRCASTVECSLYDSGQKGFTTQLSAVYAIPGVVKKVTLPWPTAGGQQQHDTYVIYTPEIKKKTAEYFNCPSLEGAELENQGGSGTVFSHLEKRVFAHETMGGIRTEVNAFSNITLALFVDSGWYQVDYSKSDDMTFGRNKGCSFVQTSCKADVESENYPFCKSDRKICSKDYTAIETCTAFAYGIPATGVPSEYQYTAFSKTHYGTLQGGPLDLGDFCPVFSITADPKTARQTTCNSPDPNNDLQQRAKLQIFSKTARCIQLKNRGKDYNNNNFNIELTQEDQSSTKKTYFWHTHGCYEHKCENGSLWLKTAKSKFYQCFQDRQEIFVERRLVQDKEDVVFNLICPPCADICGAKNCKSFTGKVPDRVGDPPRKRPSMLDTLLGNGVPPSSILVILFILTIN